ncbi:collagen alpha-1(X) chain-like [Brachypodium distachyon]|uniref:collagen alpha-1(X) chain-like n=1 Tax=Brachypodium distachyon TaxID=15368 RepID=UPI0001C71DAF|nr:collagen alpha-1(X) chain-like [Brachypodium distachyon]|eukprot:XP_024313951.1 collagen alpha-1(X) chain-like [Brachypodium distachyon]
MERVSSVRVTLVLVILLTTTLACQGARDIPAAEPKPYRPQNVFGFGGFYPGPSVNWVFPGPNGVTPQVGFGGMPGSSSFPGIGGSPLVPGGSGVVGIHGPANP